MAFAGLSNLQVKDLGKGAYAATLSTSVAGIVTVSATVNGETVGLPVTVAAEPGPLASLVACTSGPLRCTAGRQTPLYVVFVSLRQL